MRHLHTQNYVFTYMYFVLWAHIRLQILKLVALFEIIEFLKNFMKAKIAHHVLNC